MTGRTFRYITAVVALAAVATACRRSGRPEGQVDRAAPAQSSPLVQPSAAGRRPVHASNANVPTNEISLQNRCPKPIGIFVGEMPKKSAGVAFMVGPSESRRPRLRLGTKVWLLDLTGKALGSVTNASGITAIEIVESCRAILAH